MVLFLSALRLRFPKNHRAQQIRSAEIPFPESDSDFLHKKTSRQRIPRAESGGNRNSGRRDQFSLHFGRTQRNPVRLRNVQYRRNRNRKFSVLTPDDSRPFRQSGHNALRNLQIVRKDRRRRDVRNRIHGTHFVKMDLVNPAAVRFRFRLRDNPENFMRQFSGSVRHLAAVENFVHIRKVPVFVRLMMSVRLMMLVMSGMGVRFRMPGMLMRCMRFVMPGMAVMVRFVDDNVEITALQTVGFFPRNAVLHSFQIQTGQDCMEFVPVRAEIQQCRDGHVAADSSGSFQIQQFAHAMFSLIAGLPPERLRSRPGDDVMHGSPGNFLLRDRKTVSLNIRHGFFFSRQAESGFL